MTNKDILSAIPPETLSAFQDKAPEIIKESVQRSLKNKNDIVQHGDEAEKLLKIGMEYITKMLESAMSVGEIFLLKDQLSWAFDRLPHDGVEMEHLLSRFNIYRDVVDEKLPKKHSHEINRYLDWMIDYQKELIILKG